MVEILALIQLQLVQLFAIDITALKANNNHQNANTNTQIYVAASKSRV